MTSACSTEIFYLPHLISNGILWATWNDLGSNLGWSPSTYLHKSAYFRLGAVG